MKPTVDMDAMYMFKFSWRYIVFVHIKYMYSLTITFLRTYLIEVKGLAHTAVCQTSFFVAKARSNSAKF